LAMGLCNLAVEQVEDVVGPIDDDQSLIFQDEQGGFTCGSAGKPPVPLTWPPRALPSVPELLSAGVVDKDIVEFLTEVRARKMPLLDVLEDPAAAAQTVGFPLSEQSITGLNALAPSSVSRMTGVDDTDREIFGF